MLLVGRIFIGFLSIVLNDVIGPYTRRDNFRAQHDAFQTFAAAQRHVHLPVREGGLRIDDGAFEREPLAFVDGDGPGKFQRVLYESTELLLLHFFGFLVEGVFHVGPLGGHHLDVVVFAGAAHVDRAFAEAGDLADFTVVEAFVAADIVFHKHHLRIEFAFEGFVGGESEVGEIAFYFCFEGLQRLLNFRQFFGVDGLRRGIVRRQRNIRFLRSGLKMSHIAVVQHRKHVGVYLVVAHLVEQVDEGAVGLPVNVFQFDRHRLGAAQGVAAEKIDRLVMFAQEVPLFVFHHGGQLVQVADHEQLHAAERFGAVAVSAQNVVDSVEHIGAHHTDFVDHQQVETLDQADFFTRKPPHARGILGLSAGQKRAERQLEKRVNRHAPCVDSRYAGRRHDDHSFGRFLFDLVQKSGFARTCLAGQEDVLARMAHVIESKFELRIRLERHRREGLR